MRSTKGLGVVFAVLFLGVSSRAASVLPALSSQNLGTLAVNSSPASAAVTFQVSGVSSTPIFRLRYGTDFSLGQTACTGAPVSSCTVAVSFAPRYAGVRQDAVQVFDGGGNLLATTLLYGIGLAPQAVLRPGVLTSFAGTGVLGNSGDRGAATRAELNNPQGVTVDGAGNVYIADSVAQVIRKVSTGTGMITTVAGPSGLNVPTGVAVDGAGNLYIADSQNNIVRRLDAVSGAISTVAGTGRVSLSLGDGNLATLASLNNPSDIAVDPAGNLYIADEYNNRIRRVDAGTGVITTVAGGGTPGPGTDGLGDGGLAGNAVLNHPFSVALDAAGNLYIADTGDNLIREVDSGIISVVAGNGNPAYSGDGKSALVASLNAPSSVRVDAAGNLYIADAHNNLIRQVNGAGIISTVAGTLNNPGGIAIDSSGNIFIADQGSSMVREVVPGPTALTFAVTSAGEISAPQTVSIANIGNQALDFSGFSLTGNFVQQSSGATDCSLEMTVAPADSCSVAVAFAPQTAGALPGSLSLVESWLTAANLSTQVIVLGGTGTGSVSLDPLVSPASLVFPDQTTGLASAAQTVTLSNPGSAAVRITGIWITGSEPGDFSTGTCPSTLAAGRSCTIAVVFTPQAAGARSATLSLTETAGSAQFSQSVFLSGSGVVAPPVVSPATLSFNNGGAGSLPVTETVTLTNPGSVPLSILSINLAGADVFSINTNCQTQLAPLASCTVAVTFTPTASPVDPATLTFTFPSVNSKTVTLTTAAPVLSFAGPTLSLGPQTRGLRSPPVAYGIQNLSSSPVTVSAIAMGGINAADFAQVNNCGISIPAGQGCTLWLTYSPTGNSPVSSSANIVMTDSAPGSPQSIAVSGTATGLTQALITTDSPQAGKSVSGVIPIGGWAISNNAAITGVVLAVDGVTLGPATYGINRPDVCAAYPGRPGCNNVGWSSSLDTTMLGDGAHTLTVSASSAIETTTVAVPFTVANWASGVVQTTTIAIDAPSSAGNSTGVTSFQGWVIDNNAAIQSVSLTVDGVPLTTAPYGMVRRDVCAVYPNRAGCPNVGWHVPVDTRQFSNGPHTLAVTAQTATGKFTTATKLFQVTNQAPGTVTACIDWPLASTPVSGMLDAAGWAIDSSTTIASVTLSVDGVLQKVASTDSRPDVCGVYGRPQGCPNVGWNGQIDTTKFADGAHTMEVTVTNSNSQAVKLLRPFAISNLKNPWIKTTLVNIDLPGPASGLLSGVVQFAGWAIDQVTPIASMELAIDGVFFQSLQPSWLRPDVCVVYPGSAGCPQVGWETLFDTSPLGDGLHVLQVTATSQQGMRTTETANFVTSNGAQSASQGDYVVMDYPSAGATVSETVNLVGWAVNPSSNVQRVVITVDGVPTGNAQYGTVRRDVCLLMRSLDCPHVGWAYSLDTTFLSNGAHTLRAIEYASNGSASVSRSVLVSNVTGSMLVDVDSPRSNATYSGTSTFGGWVIDGASTIQLVTVSVDGLPVAPAQYGINRPDVCAVYPECAGHPYVGWSLSLNTTAFVNGAHTLQVSGLSAGNVRVTASIPFSIVN